MTVLSAHDPSSPASRRLLAAGWAVHAYTAIGTVLALLVIVAALDGKEVLAFWVLLIALIVDGTDGMLARRLRVKQTIPGFDGARLDDIVDYLTYVFAPVMLLWVGGHLPGGTIGVVFAALPLLASSFQFCRVDAKTDDHYFLGFPSYWNVVAFYVVILDLSPAITAALLVTCAALVFVPIKYIYPSRTTVMRKLNLALAGSWVVLYALILLRLPEPSVIIVALSLAYIAYYLCASIYLTLRKPRRAAVDVA